MKKPKWNHSKMMVTSREPSGRLHRCEPSESGDPDSARRVSVYSVTPHEKARVERGWHFSLGLCCFYSAEDNNNTVPPDTPRRQSQPTRVEQAHLLGAHPAPHRTLAEAAAL